MQFNLADLFESVVDVIPDRTALAVSDPRGDRHLTYAQLEARANRLAHHLLNAGVMPGEHIGVHMHNGNQYVECMLAAFKIRAVPLNVNYRYVAAELASLFADADMVALVHDRSLGDRVTQAAASVGSLRHLVTVDDGSDLRLPPGAVDYEASLAAASPLREFGPRSGDDLHIIYTGGTTGAPKGVMWRHEDLFFAGMGGGNPRGEPVSTPDEIAVLASGDSPMVMFPVPPLMHGAAQLGTFIGFFAGGTVVLLRHFDPVRVWRLIAEEHVNTASIVGDAMARPMAEALAGMGEVDTSSLLAIGSAGAIFSATVREQLQRLLPNIVLLDSFGASETGFQGMGTPGSSPDAGLSFTMNERTAVLDEELRAVAPGSGVVGRVALRGRVPLGYYKDPVKTAQTFSVIDGERWVIPGDMATVNADGTITVLGRGSMCINSGGEKIFPEEVEAALKSHPDVFDAIVVGVPDERWGERVAAVVAPRDGRSPSLDDVVSHCAARLARYKLPRLLVTVSEVVRSPSGKPDYGWARGVASAAARDAGTPATAPATTA